MGGRLLDYIAQGAYVDRPLAASMPALIQAGGASIYYANDTFVFGFFNDATVAWDELDVSALTGLFQDLGDVDWSTPPTDGQIFKWDAGSSKLIPFTIPSLPTTEEIQDAIGPMFSNGIGTNVAYDDAGNLITIDCTITQYTDELAQDAVAGILTDAGGITPVYDDAGNLINLRNSRFMIPFWFETGPIANEVLARYTATDEFTIEADLVGSKMAVETAPTADYTILVKRQVNSAGAFATIATIVILAAGGFTLTTAGSVDIAIAVNDTIKVVGAATPDATLAGGSFNLRGI